MRNGVLTSISSRLRSPLTERTDWAAPLLQCSTDLRPAVWKRRNEANTIINQSINQSDVIKAAAQYDRNHWQEAQLLLW